jgi:hypothetical protein
VMMTPPGYRLLSCTRKKLQGGTVLPMPISWGPCMQFCFSRRADRMGTLLATSTLSGRIGIGLGANRIRKDRRPRSLTFLQHGVYGRQHMVEPSNRGFEGQMAAVTGAASGGRRATARRFGAQDGRVFAAEAILFFVSRRGGFITGQVSSVSGDLTMAG